MSPKGSERAHAPKSSSLSGGQLCGGPGGELGERPGERPGGELGGELGGGLGVWHLEELGVWLAAS